MKTKLFFYRLIVSLLLMGICHLLSSQTASITQGCPPLSVNFTPPAGLSTYFWDFGNNVTSNLAFPATTYVAEGQYTVNFSNGPDQPVIGTITITVLPKPVLSIVADTLAGCAPLLVNFTNTSMVANAIQINSISWSFGDGGSANAPTQVSHTYQEAGIFTPSLSISTNLPGCNVTQNFPNLIKVNQVKEVGFTTSPDIPESCDPPLNVRFMNTTPGNNLQFSWDFGNGNMTNTANPPAQTYNAFGRFPVTLTARDELGCQGSYSQTVKIGKPLAQFVMPDTVCIGDTIFLINLSDRGEYRWTFGPAATPFITTEEDPFVIFKEGGTYIVELLVNDNDRGCESTSTKSVFVDHPDASFTSDPSYTCNDSLLVSFVPQSLDGQVYLWNFGDGTASSEIRPTHQYDRKDTSTYGESGRYLLYTQLILENPSGCRDTFFTPDTIFTPNALFMPDKIDGCAPLTVTFADSSNSFEPILHWTYDYGDGSSARLTSDDAHTHTYTQAGTYDVILKIENAAGCRDTSYALRIEVGDAIIPDFTVDQTDICPGESIQFTDLTPPDSIDAWHFETDQGRSFHCFQAPNLNWTFDHATGPMDVSLTVEFNGCQSTVTKKNLIVVKGPIARIHYEMDCADPYTFTFQDSSYDASTLRWDFGDGQTATGSTIAHTYSDTGSYRVVLSAEHATSGCPISMDTVTVFVREIQASFLLPETAICKGTELLLDASNSRGVDTCCWKGFTWIFDITDRPTTTQKDTIMKRFSIPGQETITLVTEDINGCTDTSRQSLKIYDIAANFTISDQNICLPANISFTNRTIADTIISSFSWVFGDFTSSTAENPTHVYTNNIEGIDTIPVSLYVVDVLGCSASFFDSITVYQPQSFIITDPPFGNACIGEDIKFFSADVNDAGYDFIFNWDFGNGQTSSNSPTIGSFDRAGDYIVTMRYEEVGTGCGGADSVLIIIQDYPEADFSTSIDNEPFVCFPSQVQFMNQSTASSILFHTWDFGNMQQSSETHPLASFEKGTFDIRLISSTTFGCADTAYQSITLIGPEGDFDFNPMGICEGGTATFTIQDTIDVNSYSWDFGDGSPLVDDLSPVEHTYQNIPVLGPRPVTLILRSVENGCETTVTKSISIFETRAGFMVNNSLDSIFCADTLQFTNTSTQANQYSWDFGNGMRSVLANPAIPFTPGVYQVRLAVANTDIGCKDTLIRELTLTALTDIVFLQDSICRGDTTILRLLNPQEGHTYRWQPSNLILDDPRLPNPRVAPLSTTDYKVEVMDEKGCTGEADGRIYIIPPPVWEDKDTTVCIGDTIFFANPPNPDGLYQFTWSPPLPLLVGQKDSILLLTIEDVAGCYTETYDYFIRGLTGDIKVPNVFTPNGDNINDVFKAYTDLNPADGEEVEILTMRIWNRWGQVVFEGNGQQAVWDGTHKGKFAPSDVYIYTIEMDVKVCGMKGIQVKRGDVTLVR
ncbi:MAG: PKD domain-containing protein [Saprospiraceae bacterium]